MATLVGMGSGFGVAMPNAEPRPAPKRRVQSAPYRSPNDIDFRPAAEAKRDRKRQKRLADRQKAGLGS